MRKDGDQYTHMHSFVNWIGNCLCFTLAVVYAALVHPLMETMKSESPGKAQSFLKSQRYFSFCKGTRNSATRCTELPASIETEQLLSSP